MIGKRNHQEGPFRTSDCAEMAKERLGVFPVFFLVSRVVFWSGMNVMNIVERVGSVSDIAQDEGYTVPLGPKHESLITKADYFQKSRCVLGLRYPFPAVPGVS